MHKLAALNLCLRIRGLPNNPLGARAGDNNTLFLNGWLVF